jgi:hypothetical protein
MKKVLLLMAAATASLAASAEYTPGQVVAQEGYQLTLQWANDDMATDGTNLRMGIGTNDRFFWADKANKTVKVYGEKGFEQDIKLNNNVWTNITCDQAGHVIVRVDPEHAFDGAFYSTSGVAVIDADKLSVLTQCATFDTSASSGRFDGFSQVYGDATATEEPWAIYAPRQYGGCFSEFLISGDQGFFTSEYKINVTAFQPVNGTTTATVTSTAAAQQFGANGDKIAVYANPIINVTDAAHNLANTIMTFEEILDEDENPVFEQTGKYMRTPNHIGVGGFACFTINGVDYVAYPTGNGSADGFGVCEVELVDTPVSNDVAGELKADCLKAIVYASTDENYALNYTANFYWRGISVEAVEGDPNSVYIYNCGSSKPMNAMSKWKFTVPADGEGGVNVIKVNDETAPVEYFNLQGVRVANPENGLYIKRQGDKATKVIL